MVELEIEQAIVTLGEREYTKEEAELERHARANMKVFFQDKYNIYDDDDYLEVRAHKWMKHAGIYQKF